MIDHAYACLEAMREHAIHLKSLGYQGGNIHADTGLTPEMAAADDARKQRRVDSLAEPATALCFGRIDRRDGNRFYVGRRHVQDADGEPVVTDWRAPVAVPFYRATVVDGMGLERRRRFVIEGRTLVDIFEEDLEHPDRTAASAYVPDPLLAEVERARTGTMRDIVATIQAEQDAIIRAPLGECMVVQGGPGTGKTAVGLHRVAFLLYTHREQLERERILIVGPNKIFFRYISQVLPSLGETAGVQLTIDGLTGSRYRVRAEDTPEVAAIKGDARMAAVVRNEVRHRMTTRITDITLPTAFGTVVLGAGAVSDLVERALTTERPINDSRSLVREQLVDLAWQSYLARHGTDPSVWATFVDRVRPSPEFKKALDRVWPALGAADVVRKLYSSRRNLDRAGRDLLTEAERGLLVRKPTARLNDEQWTAADLAVLDEVDARLNGAGQQYGHIIVDEAQNLTQMQLRLVARRARRGSMTVLGDLAQAAAPGAQTSWSDAIDAIAAPDTRYVELTVGYRVPASILDLANRLLPEAAPGVRPTTSARLHGEPPRLRAVSDDELIDAAVGEAADLAGRWTTTGVVVPSSLYEAVATALSGAGVSYTDGRRTSELGEHVTLLTPADTKGLEFDAVLAVEPRCIVDENLHGTRLLYVVLTRAVQELVVVHADELPRALV